MWGAWGEFGPLQYPTKNQPNPPSRPNVMWRIEESSSVQPFAQINITLLRLFVCYVLCHVLQNRKCQEKVAVLVGQLGELPATGEENIWGAQEQLGERKNWGSFEQAREEKIEGSRATREEKFEGPRSTREGKIEGPRVTREKKFCGHRLETAWMHIGVQNANGATLYRQLSLLIW